VCDDGSQVSVDTIKKVQVWPMTDVMLILLAALLFYLLRRLYAISRD
jgi:biopolymer transport protein ExbD